MLNAKKQSSELRFDVINRDWVVVAEGRGKRPEDFKNEQEVAMKKEKACPFCDLFNQAKFKDKNIAVIPNKFPAFLPAKKITIESEKHFFQKMSSVGFHEVVVFRDHQKELADFLQNDWQELFSVYQERFFDLSREEIVSYVSIFHNQGQLAGASQSHPHSQIIAIPFFDADLGRSISSAHHFFKEKGQCLFCSINRLEKASQKRIVFENSNFLAICPFASKVNFEVVIAPKNHLPFFEKITPEEKQDLAEIFQAVLRKLKGGLNNPDYNFYLHTAPCDDREYHFYHWHFTIMPRVSVWAGFELGTGIEIVTISPERAAEYLRKIKI